MTNVTSGFAGVAGYAGVAANPVGMSSMAQLAGGNAGYAVGNRPTDQALNALLPKWQKPVSEASAAEHKQALKGLAGSYDFLPKDNNGYVTIAGLQQVVNNPGDYPPEAVKAAQYFLDHPAKFAALETSRQRHQEGVTNQDGEFSEADIYNELANPDLVKQRPSNTGSAREGGPAERYPSTAEPLHLAPDWKEKAKEAMDTSPGLQLAPDWKEKAKEAMDTSPGLQLAPKSGLLAALTAGAATTATTATAAAAAASKAKVAAQADPATAAATVSAVITGANGSMTYDQLKQLADGTNPQFPPDKFPELQAAAKTIIGTPKFKEHYCEANGEFKASDLADLARNTADAKIDPNALTPEQQAAYASMDANDPKLRYKNGDPTPACNNAMEVASAQHDAKRAAELAAGYGDSNSERKRAMTDLSDSGALFGRGDDVATIGELRALANGAGHGVDASPKEVEAARKLVAYYDANGGKGGDNALAKAGGDDEKFNKQEWAAAMANMPA